MAHKGLYVKKDFFRADLKVNLPDKNPKMWHKTRWMKKKIKILAKNLSREIIQTKQGTKIYAHLIKKDGLLVYPQNYRRLRKKLPVFVLDKICCSMKDVFIKSLTSLRDKPQQIIKGMQDILVPTPKNCIATVSCKLIMKCLIIWIKYKSKVQTL